MWTTFDRYLFGRYCYTCVIFFAAVLGLFVVVDGFTNLDAFQQKGEGTIALMTRMGTHYLYQSSLIFEMVGPSLAVISAMVVLAMLLKHHEFYALLSIGVPTYRVALSLVVGVLVVNGLLIANQELVIPRISHHLQGTHGDMAHDARHFDPQYDARTWVFVSGTELVPSKRQIQEASFMLPMPQLVTDFQEPIRAGYAAYYPAQGNRPAGWLLKDAQPGFETLKLTEAGRKVVLPHKNGRDLFLKLGLTFDQLQNRNTGFRYLSTGDLIDRIQHPTSQASSTQAQVMHLHSRLTRPILAVISVLLVIPLVLRKEQDSLVANVATCTLVLALLLGIAQGMDFLGQSALVRPELAAWTPILIGGPLAGWLSAIART